MSGLEFWLGIAVVWAAVVAAVWTFRSGQKAQGAEIVRVLMNALDGTHANQVAMLETLRVLEIRSRKPVNLEPPGGTIGAEPGGG